MAHDLWTYVVKQFSSGDHFEHEVHNRPEASSYMEGIEETIEQLPIEEALYRLPDMEELLSRRGNVAADAMTTTRAEARPA